jgi:arylsulfatase A-like enzyme
MRFAVEIDGEQVWTRTLHAPNVEKDRGWKAERIDLARWEGQSIQLELITEPLDSSAHDVGGWSNVLLQRRDRIRRLTTSEAPTVLLVLVDTLRADRLGVYGNTSGLSPNLDAMARRGLFFSQAQAASSWTWPSTASVLTGVPPNVHGVQDSEHSYLVDAHLTLPELFARAGYTTAGFSSNLLIGRADNFQQGFETFVHTPYASARAMNDRVAAWLDNTEGLARFAYVHYFDPHTPYLPPPGWMLPLPDGIRPESEIAPLAAQQLAADGEPDPALVDEYRTLLMTQYDSEVRYFDHAFGELLEALEQRGVLDNCIIAFTSDHGEEFYEHEFFSHGGHLYEETLGVPLWITSYGSPAAAPEARLSPGTISYPVSNQDLLVTLCTLASLPLPESPLPAALRGRALTAPAGDDTGSATPGERPVFAQTWHGHEAGVAGFTEKLSVTTGPYKLIHTPASKRSELFNRSTDGAETVDLVADPMARDVLEQLQRTLRAWSHLTETAAQGIRVEENNESLELLRQMGYVGGEDRDQDSD